MKTHTNKCVVKSNLTTILTVLLFFIGSSVSVASGNPLEEILDQARTLKHDSLLSKSDQLDQLGAYVGRLEVEKIKGLIESLGGVKFVVRAFPGQFGQLIEIMRAANLSNSSDQVSLLRQQQIKVYQSEVHRLVSDPNLRKWTARNLARYLMNRI